MTRRSYSITRTYAERPALRLVTGPPAEGLEGSTERIRLLVVDDHPVIRDIIRLACDRSPRIEVVGEAADGVSALVEAGRLQPDVVVLDLSLPGMTGLETARRLKREHEGIRILAISGDNDPETVFECRRIGVEGFFEKTEAVEDVVGAIQAVADGEQAFTIAHDRSAHEQLGNLVRRAREAYRVASSITPRELQVLHCIAEGLTTRQTATRLQLSERTVESHIAKLYSTLGARTRVQAIVQASKLGLLEER
jgi:DNA-binding NarL/FixJ family response regulator